MCDDLKGGRFHETLEHVLLACPARRVKRARRRFWSHLKFQLSVVHAGKDGGRFVWPKLEKLRAGKCYPRLLQVFVGGAFVVQLPGRQHDGIVWSWESHLED